MANSTNKTPRSLAVLAPPKRISALITFATGVVRGMTGNPTFSSPSPALATVSAAVDDLQAAETAATTRTRGATATRDARRNALLITLHLLRIYVQSVADQDRENGPAIIQSAGMTVQRAATRNPRVFAALAGASSGTVKIVAPSAGRRASYDWQYSRDGATWIHLASTLQAGTTMTDQSPGTRLHLRYRSVTKTGQTDWSAPIAVTVR